MVGGLETKAKKRNSMEDWWVGGFVGPWVDRWDAQKELVLGTYGVIFPPKPTVVFCDGMEKSDLEDINKNWTMSNVKTL